LVCYIIDTIKLPELETEVALVIVYIETIWWAANPFEVTSVLPGPTSWMWLTALYRDLAKHL